MTFTIRDLEMSDIHACKSIIASHWGDIIAGSAETELWEMFLSNSKWPPHYLVAVDHENKVLGFAGYKAEWKMSNTYELIWINVTAEAQNMGIGIALTERRLLEIKNKGGTLVMLMTQKPAFFAQFDFKPIANFDGWVLMSKQLAPVCLDIDRSV